MSLAGVPNVTLSAVFLQVVQKTPLPFFAMSLSLSPGAQLMVVGFAGECW